MKNIDLQKIRLFFKTKIFFKNILKLVKNIVKNVGEILPVFSKNKIKNKQDHQKYGYI